MDGCCEIRAIESGQRRVLRIVLWINAVMFLVELGAGIAAASTALVADSVDMLGDALVYGFSLAVIGRGAAWQARAAIVKGAVMAGFAAGVLLEVALKLARDAVPSADVMSLVGLAALGANVAVLALLSRHREQDLNMRSVWLCSRNDVLGNASVLVAALGVWLTASAWPDIVVGLAIATLFGTSAAGVVRDGVRAARSAPTGL
ncbi:MAG TPA: cation transporter [Candidatus Tectomicrobia bacterium]|nr:cation transporter [Candidatus Tectomicrobia bacterium]